MRDESLVGKVLGLVSRDAASSGHPYILLLAEVKMWRASLRTWGARTLPALPFGASVRAKTSCCAPHTPVLASELML